MAMLTKWMSPGEAADAVYDVRAPGVTDVGLALLRPRSKAQDRTATSMAYAKLNPVEPGPSTPRTRCGWPTSARDHRLLLAPGVADPVSLERLFADYDAATSEHQKLLAAVLTVPFDRDRPLHDSFDQFIAFAMTHVACNLRLTSLAVLHAPGDQLASEGPHGHLLILSRVGTASGWAEVHPKLTESAHRNWADDWTRFGEGWRRLREG